MDVRELSIIVYFHQMVYLSYREYARVVLPNVCVQSLRVNLEMVGKTTMVTMGESPEHWPVTSGRGESRTRGVMGAGHCGEGRNW